MATFQTCIYVKLPPRLLRRKTAQNSSFNYAGVLIRRLQYMASMYTLLYSLVKVQVIA